MYETRPDDFKVEVIDTQTDDTSTRTEQNGHIRIYTPIRVEYKVTHVPSNTSGSFTIVYRSYVDYSSSIELIVPQEYENLIFNPDEYRKLRDIIRKAIETKEERFDNVRYRRAELRGCVGLWKNERKER